MNYWMSYELRRIRGERPAYPEHNAESFPQSVSPIDAADWDQLRQDFVWLLGKYAKLVESPRKELDRQIESADPSDKKIADTLEAVLWQMVAHTSYHVGQIALIAASDGGVAAKGGRGSLVGPEPSLVIRRWSSVVGRPSLVGGDFFCGLC